MIAIKDFEMPESCAVCSFISCPNKREGQYCIPAKKLNIVGWGCVKFDTRAKCCPLVEIKEVEKREY